MALRNNNFHVNENEYSRDNLFLNKTLLCQKIKCEMKES
jgi:hypothetical protein